MGNYSTLPLHHEHSAHYNREHHVGEDPEITASILLKALEFLDHCHTRYALERHSFRTGRLEALLITVVVLEAAISTATIA